MKKAFSLLLTALMLSSMLVVFTVPAFAAPRKGVGVIDITSGKQFRETLESLDSGRKLVMNLKTDMCINQEIVINANNCSILIHVDSDYLNQYGDVKIYPNYYTDDDEYRFLYIEGDNVEIYFDGHVICKDFKSAKNGGAIYSDGMNGLVANGRFYNCTAEKYGGAIFFNNANADVSQCSFKQCRAINAGGGAITFDEKDSRAEDCVFENNTCANEKLDKYRVFYGDDVASYSTWHDTVIQNCTSNSERKDNYYRCIVNPENAPLSGGVHIDAIFGTDFGSSYTRPLRSGYAQNAIETNKQCDVIRPDMADTVLSDNKLFTLKGSHYNGAIWNVTYKDPLTIKAKGKYTINRIEAFIADDIDYEELSIDKGTKKAASKYGDSISSPYIAKFDDINSDSVTITISGDITNPNTVRFNEFIIYYTEGAPDNDPVAEEVSNDFMRDGETYDIFTFKKSGASSDQPNTATSEQKGFTLTDTAVPTRGHIYGWATTINITAPKGYTITHIEGKPVHFEGNVDALDSNVGTIVDKGQRLAKDGIVRINDINASSIDISCNRDYVEFDEFLVFYVKDATLGSVFSGGALWIIFGVAATAIAAAVVILVMKKRNRTE